MVSRPSAPYAAPNANLVLVVNPHDGPAALTAARGTVEPAARAGGMSRNKPSASAGVTKSAGPHPDPSHAAPAPDDRGDEYAALVRAAADGDDAAMERLLMRAQEVAWRFSSLVCGHSGDAEDVMQDALLRTYSHVGRIREPNAFKSWLYRTVRNACLMKRRRRVDEPKHMDRIEDLLPTPDDVRAMQVPDPGLGPEALAINARLRQRLHEALKALPPSYRIVVFLRDIEGLSTREVAEVVNTSDANVKQRLHRGRLFLRKTLAEPPAPAIPSTASPAASTSRPR
jgi:RNA polymerase sigma-70 factor (ECF subfamily)